MDKGTAEFSDSILFSVKHFIGIPDDDSFDSDIMIIINNACSTLYQLGVLNSPYFITSKDDTYDDLIPNGSEDIMSQIKEYFICKTRLIFDSSTLSSTVIEVIKETIKELEWRLREAADPNNIFD